MAQFSYVDTSQGSLTFQTASDVTFSAGAVPEPGARAMMIMGFAGVGALLRRGSRRPSVAVLVSKSPSLAAQAT